MMKLWFEASDLKSIDLDSFPKEFKNKKHMDADGKGEKINQEHYSFFINFVSIKSAYSSRRLTTVKKIWKLD